MLFIILPAYNEANGLEHLFSSIDEVLKKSGIPERVFVFVDDGSTDNTFEVISKIKKEKRNILTIIHPKNEGLGASLQSAFNFLLTYLSDVPQKDDIIITMDADNTHPPELIPLIVSEIKNNNYDIVIASRFVEGASETGVPFYRKILTRGVRFLMRLTLPQNKIPTITDFTSGYRGYSGKIILDTFNYYRTKGEKLITEKGFAAGTELLFKLLITQSGIEKSTSPKIKEIPLPLRYDLKNGPSKIKLLPTIIDYLRVISKIPPHYPKKFPDKTIPNNHL